MNNLALSVRLRSPRYGQISFALRISIAARLRGPERLRLWRWFRTLLPLLPAP